MFTFIVEYWQYIIGLLAVLRAYRGLRFFFIKRRITGPGKINLEARPFVIKMGAKKVALLLHGFTTSPREFRDLARYLAKNNISVCAPLLPGHGTSPERLAVTKYYQWVEYVEEQINNLAREYDEIYIVGNSFGGNLALICAQSSPKIKGIVTLGTPIFFRRDKLNRFILFPLLRRIKIFQDKKNTNNYVILNLFQDLTILLYNLDAETCLPAGRQARHNNHNSVFA